MTVIIHELSIHFGGFESELKIKHSITITVLMFDVQPINKNIASSTNYEILFACETQIGLQLA